MRQSLVFPNCESNCTLKNIELVHEGANYYLDITLLLEDIASIRELHMPRVELGRFDSCIIAPGDGIIVKPAVDFGFGELPLAADKNGYNYTNKLVENKTRELTIAEIEKKLGYKIKIVNEK